MNKFEVGDLVLATKKSIIPETLNSFLNDCPLGITRVTLIHDGNFRGIKGGIEVDGGKGRASYSFMEEDLIKVE